MMIRFKGFTLIEILVVLVIVGILTAALVPNYIFSLEQSKAQVAQSNLLAIQAAESKYYEDYQSFCINSGSSPTCADNNTDINANLHLTISSNDPFQYSCSTASGNFAYNCSATDGLDTLTLNPNAVIPASAPSCYGNTNFSSCPVTCSDTKNSNSYCPSNLQ